MANENEIITDVPGATGGEHLQEEDKGNGYIGDVPDHIVTPGERAAMRARKLKEDIEKARLAGSRQIHYPQNGTTHEVPGYQTTKDVIAGVPGPEGTNDEAPTRQ